MILKFLLTCMVFFWTANVHAHASRIPETVIQNLQQQLRSQHLSFGAPVFIRIFKAEKMLEVWLKKGDTFTRFKTYPICYFSGTLGPKEKEGDGQSPEGFYMVRPSQMNPASQFHLSFNLGYPNTYDRAYGRTGGQLMVHGNCVSIGCYAMTDERINEIYALAEAALAKGQPFFRVHVFPFHMTAQNMRQHKGYARWQSFWQNLKQGYDFFETHQTPPDVTIIKKQYVFS